MNPDLNAMIDDNFEEALKEAKLVDERVQRELGGNRKPGEKSIQEYPFLGVPFTAKDSIGVKGKSLTGGLAVRKDVKAEMDCEAVKRMKEIGGAIFLGVTNVPELLLSGSCFNRVYGQTNNPYDKSRVPGGSSGGEGSLLGAGASVIGVSIPSILLILLTIIFLDWFGSWRIDSNSSKLLWNFRPQNNPQCCSH